MMGQVPSPPFSPTIFWTSTSFQMRDLSSSTIDLRGSSGEWPRAMRTFRERSFLRIRSTNPSRTRLFSWGVRDLGETAPQGDESIA